jgi:aryl-alcohol dehydrogenase-like predicted oxidoreductase
VSRVGFGGYRVDDRTPEHREALEAALDAGCTLIDTSTNYTDGGSERLVGRVLADRMADGRLARDAVVVVSKIGYVQGGNLALAVERERAARPFPEMVKYGDGIWHDLHPEFLADQLGRSLERLRLDRLDVLLLHNPEYFLSDAAHRGEATDPDALERLRAEFYRRLREAFRYLESQVAAGRIGWYGVSSNTVAKPDTDPEATSLARMLAVAHEAGGGRHHFGVLQLPMNLVESDTAPVLHLAARERLGVLVNRPLNAAAPAGMLRLASVPLPDAPALGAQRAVLERLETEYRVEIAPHVQVRQGSVSPADLFRWSEELAAVAPRVRGLTHWEQIEWQMVAPAVRQVVRALDGLGSPVGDRWRDWRGRYLPQLDRMLAAVRREAAAKSAAVANAVAARIDPALPPERRGESLSRKAIWTLASTPGVTSVLVGMRKPDYVADAMAVLDWPPLDDPSAVYAAMRRP